MPCAKLLALFDLKREALERGGSAGCFAINASIEYDGKHQNIVAACRTFLNSLEDLVFSLCKEAKCTDPKTAARKIVLLFEGAIIYGQSKQDPAIIDLAKGLARAVLNEYHCDT